MHVLDTTKHCSTGATRGERSPEVRQAAAGLPGRTGSTASDTGASAVLTMWPPGRSAALKAHCGAGTLSTVTRAGTAGEAPPQPAHATLSQTSCAWQS